MIQPRIAVCIPSGDRWHAEMALSLVSLVRNTPLDMMVFNLMGSQISLQRNELVRKAQAHGATHIYWQDSDMTFPDTTVMELLAHEKEIVGATYCKRVPPYKMLGIMEKAEGRLKPASYMPGGCMLVRTDVYSTIGWPWYFESILETAPTGDNGAMRGEDYNFCHKAREKGFKIWCDIQLSQRIAHLGSQSIVMQLREGHPDRWVPKEHGHETTEYK